MVHDENHVEQPQVAPKTGEPEGARESEPQSEPEGAVESEPQSEPEGAVEWEPQAEPEGAVESEPQSKPAEASEQAPAEAPEQGPAQSEFEVPAKPLATGQIVDGLIVHLDEEGALVDVGTKSEGRIPAHELGGADKDEKPVAVGDRVAVYVVKPEDDEGNPVLSKKRADYDRVWQRVIQAHETGEVLSALVTDRVKGGLVVDLGMRGFLPASHVRTRNVHALDRFVGQSLRVKIIEVDRGRKRVVVSQRQAIEEERRKRREKTLESITENQVCRGVVRRITDYGAFVDLGGVDGLLHITEMSWTRIGHPSDVVKTGQKIEVMVLRFDREQKRISLGLKQILPDPWDKLRDEYRVGQTVAGTVSRVVPFGAFVRLESGIEGVIPNSELPGERGQRAQSVLKEGQSVQAKIVNLRSEERRMTLSLRQAQRSQERRELKDYMSRQEDASRVTIGDLVGDVLAKVRVAEPAEETAEEVAAEKEIVADAAEVEAEAKAAVDAEAKAAVDAEAKAEEPAEETEEEPPEEVEAAAEEEKPTDVEGESSPEAGEEAKESEEGSGEGVPCSSSESQAESEAEKE